MSLASVGKVDIYAEVGENQWDIVKKRIEDEMKRRKLKDGDRYFMQINLDEPMLIEIKVTKWSLNQEREQ